MAIVHLICGRDFAKATDLVAAACGGLCYVGEAQSSRGIRQSSVKPQSRAVRCMLRSITRKSPMHGLR